MTDQVRIGDDGQLEIERTWDGEPLWSVETQQDELFAGDAFQQMPGQLPIEEDESMPQVCKYCCTSVKWPKRCRRDMCADCKARYGADNGR